MIKIDKSAFTPEELATYQTLIAKARVEYEDDMDDDMEDEMEGEIPTEPAKKKCKTPMAKSASPELTAALERLATLEKSVEMKEFTDVAKKYAPLGENEETLAQTLYDMKKSNEANYNAYIAVLDKSLGLVEKSGLFTEIGKSTSGTAGGVIDKIEAAANEIQKSDATLSRDEAIAKAWENNPNLIAEYDNEYKARR